jgi:1-acyl-sn-glycerol-3-phosphate acyltransferase
MVKAQGAGVAQARFRRVVWPVIKRYWDFDLKGYERLPAEGPAILCPNHLSFIDSVFVAATVTRNISFVGKAEYMDSWKTKYLFPMLGMIPIDRTGGSKARAALDTAARVLERGELFGIFPEGTRTRDGKLHKGRTGASRLAMETGAPIYPIGIIGTDRALPPDSVRPRRGKVTIAIGRPIRPERYVQMPERHRAYRAMIDEVMFEIRELSGQEYANTYSGKADEAAEGVETREAARPAHVHEPHAPVEASAPDAELDLATV